MGSIRATVVLTSTVIYNINIESCYSYTVYK